MALSNQLFLTVLNDQIKIILSLNIKVYLKYSLEVWAFYPGQPAVRPRRLSGSWGGVAETLVSLRFGHSKSTKNLTLKSFLKYFLVVWPPGPYPGQLSGRPGQLAGQPGWLIRNKSFLKALAFLIKMLIFLSIKFSLKPFGEAWATYPGQPA